MSMESMDKKSPIRRARERKGLTQRRLAELLGMDGQTVGSWERGTRFPHVEVRAKLSEVLGTSLEDLGLQERETQAMMEKSPEDLGLLSPTALVEGFEESNRIAPPPHHQPLQRYVPMRSR